MPVIMYMEKDRTEKIAVCLSLDLKEYCEACLLVQEQRKELALAQSEKTSGLTLVAKIHSQLMEARAKQAMAKHDLSKHCLGLYGDLCWDKIKKMLSEQCPSGSLLQQQLSSSGIDSTSLAIESLDYSFTEFLKNSIDAMVKKYLERKDSHSLLQFRVMIEQQDDTITCVLTDNAGGFSNAYLSNFKSYTCAKSYRERMKASEKQEHADFFLGGRKLGMRIFLSLLLDGTILEHRPRQIYNVKKGETTVEIENISSGAASSGAASSGAASSGAASSGAASSGAASSGAASSGAASSAAASSAAASSGAASSAAASSAAASSAAADVSSCVKGACFRITAPIWPPAKATKTAMSLGFELEVPKIGFHRERGRSASEGGFFSTTDERSIGKRPRLEFEVDVKSPVSLS